jgi:hypothetical protein
MSRPPILAHLSHSMSRRGFLAAAFAAGTSTLVPRLAWAAHHEEDPLATAIEKSTLVYISPLQANGNESTCHGEVWFVADAGDLLVVTNPERWRAAAIGKGLDRARIWVGDHGVWTSSNEAFKKSPSAVAKASLDRDPKVHARALAEFGGKYSDSWAKWGPRFREGLASGERVLIRYSPAT